MTLRLHTLDMHDEPEGWCWRCGVRDELLAYGELCSRCVKLAKAEAESTIKQDRNEVGI